MLPPMTDARCPRIMGSAAESSSTRPASPDVGLFLERHPRLLLHARDIPRHHGHGDRGLAIGAGADLLMRPLVDRLHLSSAHRTYLEHVARPRIPRVQAFHRTHHSLRLSFSAATDFHVCGARYPTRIRGS